MALNFFDSRLNSVGLGTFTHTAAQHGIYRVNVEYQMLPGSELSIVIKKNSDTIATSTEPNSIQTRVGIQRDLNLAVSDVISVVVTSSVMSDNYAIGTIQAGRVVNLQG